MVGRATTPGVEPCDTRVAKAGASIVAQFRDLIDEAAERTRDPDLLRVARAFRRQPGGRPAKDDRAALAEAKLMLAKRGPLPEWAILLRVARRFFPYEEPRSAAERLRKKLRKETSMK